MRRVVDLFGGTRLVDHTVSPTVDLLGYDLNSYALVRTSYLLLALALTLRLNGQHGIEPRVTVTAFAIGVPAGVLGARGLDVLEYWGKYRAAGGVFLPLGSSIYGAFLLMIPIIGLYARASRVPMLRFFDGGAPAMALGEAMTRVGCFLNGCCYGTPWNGPLAVEFPAGSFVHREQQALGILPIYANHSLPVHPVQLYSAAAAAVIFVVLLLLLARPHRDGDVLFSFLATYGVLRLAVAPFRAEALTTMKLFSVAFVVIGVFGLLCNQANPSRRRRAPLPSPVRPT